VSVKPLSGEYFAKSVTLVDSQFLAQKVKGQADDVTSTESLSASDLKLTCLPNPFVSLCSGLDLAPNLSPVDLAVLRPLILIE